LARAKFLSELERLGKSLGMILPKGASSAVEETARRIAATKGKEHLRLFAKIHFKTTDKI
jgi:ribonuclease HIII